MLTREFRNKVEKKLRDQIYEFTSYLVYRDAFNFNGAKNEINHLRALMNSAWEDAEWTHYQSIKNEGDH